MQPRAILRADILCVCVCVCVCVFVFVFVCNVMLLINLNFEPIFPWLEVLEKKFFLWFFYRKYDYSGMAEYR